MVKQTRVRHRMNFDYLEGFLEVAKVKNFSRAASILYRTQPTLSQQIQRLEREFGGKLFDRDFKAVRLTQAGSTLRRYAEEIAGPAHRGLGRHWPDQGEPPRQSAHRNQ